MFSSTPPVVDVESRLSVNAHRAEISLKLQIWFATITWFTIDIRSTEGGGEEL